MGVVYKLKNEVVDFILREKRDDPSLSCRHLAMVTGEKFFIKVSKSSINTIIKNASLSSAVGRRSSSEGGGKKFHIPVFKKTQISEEMRKAGFKVDTKPSPEVPVHGGQPKKQYSSADGVSKQQLFPASSQDHVFQLRMKREQERGALYEGMGFIFLKAAQWDLFDASILGSLFSRAECGTTPKTSLPLHFDMLCDIWFYLKLSGAQDINQIGQFCPHGAWIFNTLNYQPLDPSLLDGTKFTMPPLHLLMEYVNEKEYLFEEISRFQIHLEDSTILTMDPQLVSLWREDVPGEFSSPMNKAMAMLSHCLISNNRPAIFLGSLGGQLGRDIYTMMAAAEGFAGKMMTKITAFNHYNDQIAEFTAIPKKKRFFIAGIWPGQKEFPAFTQEAFLGAPNPFYNRWLDKEGCFMELNPAIFSSALEEAFGKNAPLKAVAVFDKEGGEPRLVVLANQIDSKAESLLEAFFLRWPNLDKGAAGSMLHGNAAEEVKESYEHEKGQICEWGDRQDTFDIYRDFGERLNSYCQRHFFSRQREGRDLASMISKYYNIPGHCMAQDKVVSVYLRVPPSYPFLEDLKAAVQRLNESAVTDPVGRNLLINII